MAQDVAKRDIKAPEDVTEAVRWFDEQIMEAKAHVPAKITLNIGFKGSLSPDVFSDMLNALRADFGESLTGHITLTITHDSDTKYPHLYRSTDQPPLPSMLGGGTRIEERNGKTFCVHDDGTEHFYNPMDGHVDDGEEEFEQFTGKDGIEYVRFSNGLVLPVEDGEEHEDTVIDAAEEEEAEGALDMVICRLAKIDGTEDPGPEAA